MTDAQPTRRMPLLAVAASAAASMLLAACGTATVPSGGSATAPPSTTSGAAVSSALSFRGTTVRGAAFDGSTLRGRPVVLWFWAPWCTICRGEAPTVTRVAARFAGRVPFIGVAGLGTVPEMRSFITDTHTGSMTHVADTTGAVWRQDHVVTQPSFVFVWPDGRSDLVVGAMDEATLSRFTAAIASAAATPAAADPASPSASPSASTDSPASSGGSATHYSDMMPLSSS